MNDGGLQLISDFPNFPLFVLATYLTDISYNQQIQKNLLDTLNVEVQVDRIRINTKLKIVSQIKLQLKFLHGAEPTSKFLSFYQLNVVQVTNVSINNSLQKNRESSETEVNDCGLDDRDSVSVMDTSLWPNSH
jgi:hypothetical protein